MKLQQLSQTKIQLLIVLISALLFIPFTGQVHLFDWDEINFAESAREMLETGNYLEVQVDYQTFWEKPPLFIWMQALSMKLFGVNEFAARFPNAVCGIFTLLVLYNIGSRLYNKRFGLLWVLVYLASFFPFFYFKTGIIDPWFNLFMFLGLYYLFRYFRGRDTLQISLAALFTGLAVLTKGPVGVLIVGLAAIIYLFFVRFRVVIKWWDALLFLLIVCLTGGFWFLLMLLKGESQMIVDFIQYQIRLFRTEDAGHGGFLLYHFVVIFIGVFPASVFALKGFRRTRGGDEKAAFRRLMKILFWTVMILFTIVNTKIIHYSSLAWYPVTFLAAYVIMNIQQRNYRFPLWMKIVLGVMSGVYAMMVAALPFFDAIKHRIIEKGWIKDPFAMANLEAEAGWLGFEGFVGLFLIGGFVWMLIRLKKRRYKSAVYPFLIGSVIFIYTATVFVTPRVERYSQNAAIEFYQSLQGKDVYVAPLGFKSYAHLFYSRKPEPEVHRGTWWKLNAKIDKPAYFVTKIHKLQNELEKHPGLEVLYEKNGFVFCVRKPHEDEDKGLDYDKE